MHITAAVIAGFGLGLIYFGGLWATVRTVATHGAFASLTFSFAARLAALAVCLWALCEQSASAGRLIPALFGVWVARGGIFWWLSRGGHSHAA